MRRWTSLALLWCVLWAVLCPVGSGAADDVSAVERKIKAAYLYNFAKFVIWPASVLGTNSVVKFTIGVAGDKLLADELQAAVVDKMIGDHHIDVRLLNANDNAARCHILFIGANEQGRVEQILAQIGTASVLTVSEAEHFVQKGGIVQLYRRDNKIRFEINSETARKADLKVSAKLLQLSKAP